MSFISGSNSLTPATAGVLDISGVIVEKCFFGNITGRDLDVCGECELVFVGGLLLLMQVQKDFCCRSGRIAVRLIALGKEDMSNVLLDQFKAVKEQRRHQHPQSDRAGSSYLML